MRQPFGQNFLIDTHIARKIVDAAGITSTSSVIEIGPGKGVLTDIAAALAGRYTAIEIDRDLAALLVPRFASLPSVTVLNADFLRWDDTAAAPETIYLSNLPYNVATAIIEKILLGGRWRTAVFMVQKEVGERIAAAPGTSTYGSFSVLCRYFAESAVLFRVPPGCFAPPPKVDSVIVRLSNRGAPPPPPDLLAIVRACFQHKRKTIANSLSLATGMAKDAAIAALERAGIAPGARAQQLPLESFLSLTQTLQK